VTWQEMIDKLRESGHPESLLPVRGSAEGRYSLEILDGQFVVGLMERDKVQRIAAFPTESQAIDFLYDRGVFSFALNGDKRREKWNRNRRTNPLPKAEDFGGRSLT
jgi:hypothetical protein